MARDEGVPDPFAGRALEHFNEEDGGVEGEVEVDEALHEEIDGAGVVGDEDSDELEEDGEFGREQRGDVEDFHDVGSLAWVSKGSEVRVRVVLRRSAWHSEWRRPIGAVRRRNA